ncbi:unnamed protein product [Dovyalis caffra]|uniref:Uncharacterized protein n=1 Tax=Dovyalis caffra TaxID=77055 RepID=A0AAV1QQP1_9ROSI|nr:unnamed protein product [Dovyalis caffra]
MIRGDFSKIPEVTFEFNIDQSGPDKDLKVKRCGDHLVPIIYSQALGRWHSLGIKLETSDLLRAYLKPTSIYTYA